MEMATRKWSARSTRQLRQQRRDRDDESTVADGGEERRGTICRGKTTSKKIAHKTRRPGARRMIRKSRLGCGDAGRRGRLCWRKCTVGQGRRSAVRAVESRGMRRRRMLRKKGIPQCRREENIKSFNQKCVRGRKKKSAAGEGGVR